MAGLVSNQHLLATWVTMATVLVTGPTVTVTHNSPFSSLAVAVTIASTHFPYPYIRSSN